MILLAGVLIPLAIGLTGVGAGINTAPLLNSVFHVPPAEAIGAALVFGAVTKSRLSHHSWRSASRSGGCASACSSGSPFSVPR